jgi:hypothetical protein
MSEPSYIELCLRAMPPEKQAAARAAFHDLTEGSPDDSMLSRLLIVLEATAAYGRTIPAEITTAMQNGVAALDARLAKLGTGHDSSGHGVAQFHRELADRFSTVTEPLGEQRQMIESVRFAVEQVNRDVQRLRHARVTAVLFLMIGSAIVGAAGLAAYFKPRYVEARSVKASMDYLARRGIQIDLADAGNNAVAVIVTGPATIAKGTDWTRDPKGRVTGAQVMFSP